MGSKGNKKKFSMKIKKSQAYGQLMLMLWICSFAFMLQWTSHEQYLSSQDAALADTGHRDFDAPDDIDEKTMLQHLYTRNLRSAQRPDQWKLPGNRANSVHAAHSKKMKPLPKSLLERVGIAKTTNLMMKPLPAKLQALGGAKSKSEDRSLSDILKLLPPIPKVRTDPPEVWKLPSEYADENTFLQAKHTGNIRDPLVNPSPSIGVRLLELTKPNIPYLGITVDASRNYFPIDWLHNLMDLMVPMNFNMIHLRLSGDYAFHADFGGSGLGRPGPDDPRIYSDGELEELVAYGNAKGIVIVPELDVPGHAGGWTNQKDDLLVNCPVHACSSNGNNIPLNVKNPAVYRTVKEMLFSVKRIFTSAPFFHLGGNNVKVDSAACLEEAGLTSSITFVDFENGLGQILRDVGIPASDVIRYQTSSEEAQEEEHPLKLVKGMDHYWKTYEFVDLNKIGFNNAIDNDKPVVQFVTSVDLNLAKNDGDGQDVFYRCHNNNVVGTMAIIVDTSELGVEGWLDRNVIGRLVAVAMGADRSRSWDSQQYKDLCHKLDLPTEMCELGGKPVLERDEFRRKHEAEKAAWKTGLCNRMS